MAISGSKIMENMLLIPLSFTNSGCHVYGFSGMGMDISPPLCGLMLVCGRSCELSGMGVGVTIAPA